MNTPEFTIDRLRVRLLEQQPLWRDILTCRRQGFSETMTANSCGIKLKTLHRHLVQMAELGLLEGKV